MTAFRLKNGFVTNPLTIGKARNLTCPCGSKKKAKRCCGIVKFVSEGRASKINIYISRAIEIPRKEMEFIIDKQLELKNKLNGGKKIEGEV